MICHAGWLHKLLCSIDGDTGVRLIFINRFFFPDHSATSQMLTDLAFSLVQSGYRVEIITSRQRYNAPGIALTANETVQGVTIRRVWTSRFGRQNLLGRACDYFTFYLSAGWLLWRIARREDVIIAKTDPPMFSVLAWPVARLRRAKLINWLQDIFPEVAERIGVGNNPVARIGFAAMKWLRDGSLKGADANVVVGERMAEHLLRLGIASFRIHLIPNWADGSVIRPVDRTANPLRQAWGLGDDFVVGYSGNLGRAHETETLIAAISTARAVSTLAADSIQPQTRVHWLFIGGGALMEGLRQRLKEIGVSDCVEFHPYVAREKLSESLSAADVHLISLRPELEGLVVPSKVYGIAAAGRPMIFIGDADGEIARVISRYACGVTVDQGDGAGLARAVLAFAGAPETCRAMGLAARRAFEAELDRTVGAERWKAVFTRVAAQDVKVAAIKAD